MIRTISIKAVKCDLALGEECHEEFAGTPGEETADVRTRALAADWKRARSALSRGVKDACPACVEKLQGLGL